MSWPPIDSEDAREMRERDEDGTLDELRHAIRCRRGWLLDRDGERVPCLRCKPHIVVGDDGQLHNTATESYDPDAIVR